MWTEERVPCPAIPHCSPQSLQAALQLVNIQTLAFTTLNTLPWRVYLYTHTHRTRPADTPHSTLILGELLHTGDANHKAGANQGTARHEQEEGRERMEMTAHGGEDSRVKVTLKQQPRDDEALRGFTSILGTVLHTLSSERA